MPEVARRDDETECPADESTGWGASLADLVGLGGGKHEGGPLDNATPNCVMVNAKPVIRLADHAACKGPLDTVIEGAATVLVCGLPVARKGDGMEHNGLIVEGSADFLVGGATFSLPEVIDIHGPADYVSEVVRDLYLISTTESGKALFERLQDAGQTVDINEHLGDNGFASPHDGDDAEAGVPTGTNVKYNPDYRSNAYDDGGDAIAQPPTVILFHEMIHALNNSEGTHAYVDDPTPPASQPNIPEEEAKAIGTGSHDADYPTENSFRDDLGLDRRDNHYGTGGPEKDEPDPVDLRPGEC